MKRIALAVALLVSLAAPALADFDEGQIAFSRGDYATAFRELKPLAEQGDAAAQVYLGFMYNSGWGTPQDYAEAAKWYRRAADQGYATAQYNLGLMYTKGDSVQQDYAEAVKWYRLAAEQGEAAAQYNLGTMYTTGRGVPQDDANALTWLRRAAEQGLVDAQFRLGVMYKHGQGVQQDDAEVLKWYRRAAEQGHAVAAITVGMRYYDGEGVPQDYIQAVMWLSLAAAQGVYSSKLDPDNLAEIMTPADVSKAQRLATEARARLDFVARDLPGVHKLPTKSKAFEGEPKSEGDPGIGAEVALKPGDAFKVGWDAYKRRDYATATREFMALAEQGDARARVTLQTMEVFDEGGPWNESYIELMERLFIKQSFGEAARWFRSAANQGDAKAWTLLVMIYDEGYGLPQDSDESMNLLRKAAGQGLLKAAEQGEVLAQKYLAFYMGFANKMTESNYWTRKAAEQGDRWAQRHHGGRYMHGPNADRLLAYMWLDLAAAQGARGAEEARDQVSEKMTPDQIAEAQRLAREWEPKSE